MKIGVIGTGNMGQDLLLFFLVSMMCLSGTGTRLKPLNWLTK